MNHAMSTELAICLNPALVLRITTTNLPIKISMLKTPSKTLRFFSSNRLEYLFGAARIKKVTLNPLTATPFIQNALKSVQKIF